MFPLSPVLTVDQADLNTWTLRVDPCRLPPDADEDALELKEGELPVPTR
jgi:hypothetical protein